jgi:hypothetical protein
MSQPIEQSGSKLFVGEDLNPLGEGQIGRLLRYAATYVAPELSIAQLLGRICDSQG